MTKQSVLDIITNIEDETKVYISYATHVLEVDLALYTLSVQEVLGTQLLNIKEVNNVIASIDIVDIQAISKLPPSGASIGSVTLTVSDLDVDITSSPNLNVASLPDIKIATVPTLHHVVDSTPALAGDLNLTSEVTIPGGIAITLPSPVNMEAEVSISSIPSLNMVAEADVELSGNVVTTLAGSAAIANTIQGNIAVANTVAGELNLGNQIVANTLSGEINATVTNAGSIASAITGTLDVTLPTIDIAAQTVTNTLASLPVLHLITDAPIEINSAITAWPSLVIGSLPTLQVTSTCTAQVTIGSFPDLKIDSFPNLIVSNWPNTIVSQFPALTISALPQMNLKILDDVSITTAPGMEIGIKGVATHPILGTFHLIQDNTVPVSMTVANWPTLQASLSGTMSLSITSLPTLTLAGSVIVDGFYAVTVEQNRYLFRWEDIVGDPIPATYKGWLTILTKGGGASTISIERTAGGPAPTVTHDVTNELTRFTTPVGSGKMYRGSVVTKELAGVIYEQY